MEITYEEYKQECLDDIHLEAQIDGTTYDDYFLTDTLGKLVAMGELIDPQPLCVNKKGRNNRIMSFDALAFDESDKSVVLISNEFKDSVLETLTLTEINKIQTRMLNFLEEAYEGTLEKYFDIYDDVLKIGRDIARRMHIDYVNAENDESIDKINLIIIRYSIQHSQYSCTLTIFKTIQTLLNKRRVVIYREHIFSVSTRRFNPYLFFIFTVI